VTEAGTWIGDGAEARLGQEVAAWHDALPLHGTPAEVFARASMRSREDIAEDKAREDRRAELRERARDEADMIRMGRMAPPPTHLDIIARAAALGEIQDRRKEAQRQRELQEAKDRSVERWDAARRELAKQTAGHSRALRAANDAHAARHAAEQAAASYRRAVYG
jgi:hypothetical protein